MADVLSAWHYSIKENRSYTDWKSVGVFSDSALLDAALAKLVQFEGFKQEPNNFFVWPTKIDRASWLEGFRSVQVYIGHRQVRFDLPIWFNEDRPDPTVDAWEFTESVLDQKFGAGSYAIGPCTEFELILNWVSQYQIHSIDWAQHSFSNSFQSDLRIASLSDVYCLEEDRSETRDQRSYDDIDRNEKIIGIFSAEIAAVNTIEHLKSRPGFSGGNFKLDHSSIVLNKHQWLSGFTVWSRARW